MVFVTNVVTPGEVDRIIESLEQDPEALELVALLVLHLANRRFAVADRRKSTEPAKQDLTR